MRKVYTLSVFLLAVPCVHAQYPGQMFPGVPAPIGWPATDIQSFAISQRPDIRPSGESVSITRLRHKPPGKALAFFTRGLKRSEAEAWQQASLEFSQAVAIDPDFSEAHGNLGVAYTRLELLDQAAVEFRRAIALDPATGIHHTNLAYALYRLDHEKEAALEAQAGVDLDAANAQSQYLLGFLLARFPETRSRAAAHLQYAARKVPEAHAVLADMYSAEGAETAAASELKTYQKLVNRGAGLSPARPTSGLRP